MRRDGSDSQRASTITDKKRRQRCLRFLWASSMVLQIVTPNPLWPLLLGDRRGRRGWRRRGRGCRGGRTGAGRAEQQARGVAVQVNHRAADIAERTPAIG